MSLNQDYIVVAKIGAPHGVRGDLKLHVFCQNPADILRFKHLLISTRGQWRSLSGCQIKPGSGHYLIHFDRCEDRDQARQYVNLELAITRDELPDLDEGDYYQADLMGLTVCNEQGECFGQITALLETGANDVLVVQSDQEYLIPYLDHVVLSVDLNKRQMVVDWQKDYL